MYDFVVNLIGEVPEEFTFIYTILTLALALLTLSLLFQLFYIPIMLVRK